MSHTTHSHSTLKHLRSDIAAFAGVFAVVLIGVVGLYIYDLKTNVVSTFASELFRRLID